MLIYVHSATVISFCLRECLWQKEREREGFGRGVAPPPPSCRGSVSVTNTHSLSLSSLWDKKRPLFWVIYFSKGYQEREREREREGVGLEERDRFGKHRRVCATATA